MGDHAVDSNSGTGLLACLAERRGQILAKETVARDDVIGIAEPCQHQVAQAGDPAHPVQHSVITANSFGFFLRGVVRPLDFGSHLSSSGTIPTALVAPGTAGMRRL